MDLYKVNHLSENEFENIFGNIVECYSKTAKYLYSKKPFEDEKDFIEKVSDFLDHLPFTGKNI